MGTAASTSLDNATPILAATIRRVNPHHLWSGLTKDQQKAIGAIALLRSVAELRMLDGVQDGWRAAEFAAGDALCEAVAGALGNEQIEAMDLPNLAVIGTPFCSVCGCTDACGCAETCWWVAPGLCSNCAPRAIEAAANLPPELLTFIEPCKGTALDSDPTLLACLKAGLVEIYGGARGLSAWTISRLGELLMAAAASAREVEAHD